MSASAIPPAVIADAVSAARGFLRLEGDAEQALLERLAATAILLGEAYTGTVFVTRAVEDVVSSGGDWRLLAAAPVSAIAGLTGLLADGAPFVLPVDAYAVDIDGDGRGWVRVSQPGAAGRVAVSYTAGLAATWDALPAPLAQGVTALIAHLFDDRSGATQPPAAVAVLWRPFRRIGLGVAEHQA